MQAQAVDAEPEYRPGGLCLVAADEWGAAQALTMACAVLSRWVPPANITAWYYADGGWRVSTGTSVWDGKPPGELPPLFPPVNALRHADSIRKFQGLSQKTAIQRWAGRGWQTSFRLMTLMGLYGSISAAHLQSFAGEPSDGRDTKRRLKHLVKLKLAEVVAESTRAEAKRPGQGAPLTIARRSQNGRRYGLATAGRFTFALGHGGSTKDLASQTLVKTIKAEKWPEHHQDILYEVLAQFSERGCAVAPGWRSPVTLSDGRMINPDGVVLLRTPWARGWNYLEVELTHDYHEKVGDGATNTVRRTGWTTMACW